MVSVWDIIQSSASSDPAPTRVLSQKPRVLPQEALQSYAASPDIPEDSVADYLSESFLSLDLSPTSTGVYVNVPDNPQSFVLPALFSDTSHPHYEVLLRRSLQDCLLSELSSRGLPTSYDHIMVEDAFSGRSKTVARTLYGLNSSIDELILDSRVLTKNFHRINNVSWKSRWTRYVSQDIAILNDKDRVKAALSYSYYQGTLTCLAHLQHLDNSSQGFQDRVDAFSIGASVFLPSSPSLKMVPWSHIAFKTSPSFDDLVYQYPAHLLSEYTGRVLKNSLRKTVSSQQSRVFISTLPAPLGVISPNSHLPEYIAFHHKDLDISSPDDPSDYSL